VTAAYDKGAGKGAVIYTETAVRSAADGQPMFTLVLDTSRAATAASAARPAPDPQPHELRAQAGATVTLATRKDQALLTASMAIAIRCTPIPSSRKRVGFRRRSCMAFAPTASPAARSCKRSPPTTTRRSRASTCASRRAVYPGESIATDMWIDSRTCVVPLSRSGARKRRRHRQRPVYACLTGD
jgi:hypothetical protein